MSYVIVECGSVARGDANPNSDLDLVCIWDGLPPDFKDLKNRHGKIMFYSCESIIRMKEKGSLFLTHLDVDSIYVDGNPHLMDLFRGYRPNTDLISNLSSETLDFILKIGWHPSNKKGILWLGDVLYVALRNFIYCRNAVSGTYVFGYRQALVEFGLSSYEISVMEDIRQSKYMFRDQTVGSDFSFDISDFSIVCGNILKRNVSIRSGGKTQWSSDWRHDYWGARLIERAIINGEICDDKFLDLIKNHNYSKRFIRSGIEKIINQSLLNC